MRTKTNAPILDKILHIRLTSVEYKQLLELAEKDQKKPSAFYRDKLKALIS